MERDSSQDSAASGVATLEPERVIPANGGFPEPPAGALIREVKSEHDACGHETRVRLPAHLPATAVRRVVCSSCAAPYEATAVEELDLIAPTLDATRAKPGSWVPRSVPGRPSLPDWARNPSSRAWRLASIPLAAAAVIGALLLIQGGSDDSETPFAGAVAEDAGAPAKERGGAGDAGPGAEGASLVRESSFSLALPSGWERTSPSGGATFAAAADGGGADATLWVENDPDLDFAGFEARSMDQLEALAGSAQVVERVTAPTPEASVVRLAADAPPGSPAYEVTLRASGPYRYYLATTVQPDASESAVDGAKLIHGSFVPSGAEPAKGGEG